MRGEQRMSNNDKKENEPKNSVSNEDLFIPPVPPPRSKPPVPEEELPEELAIQVQKAKNSNVQPIVMMCDRCGEKIVIRVPLKRAKDLFRKKKQKPLFVSYIHFKTVPEDFHCVVFEINPDFSYQLVKVGDVIVQTEESKAYTRTNKPPEIHMTYAPCDRCKEPAINVPVPEFLVEQSKIYSSPLAYVHQNLKNQDKHCTILYLDPKFGDRDARVCDFFILQKIT